MSDLEDLEEIAEQNSLHVNERDPNKGPKQKVGLYKIGKGANVFAGAKRIKRKPVTLPDRA